MNLLLGVVFLLAIQPSFAAAQTLSAGGVPSDATIRKHLQQAVVAHKTGDLETAAKDYQRVIEEAPGFAEAYMNLGLVRHQEKRFEEAIHLFRQALKRKPTLQAANSVLGLDLYLLGEPVDAIPYLKKGVDRTPNDTELTTALGMAYFDSGQWHESEQV